MCHHFNYSDIHWGHTIVPLEEAYRKLRLEYKENLGLLLSMKQFVDKRLNYFETCRSKFKKDKEEAEKSIDIYIIALIRELKKVQEEKKKGIQELFETLENQII